MPMISLTRCVSFKAVHRYCRPEWSDEKNEAVFGDRALQQEHSHRYSCEVTVSGPVADDTGMLVDLRVLDQTLRTEVVDRFDGHNLNRDVSEFREGRQMPTCENLARMVAARMQFALEQAGATVAVTEVTVAEDPTLRATWRAQAHAQSDAEPGRPSAPS